MPDAWMPGLRHDPGRSAGYPRGRVRMQWCKHHDTAGTNSYNVCKWGRPGYSTSLCQILLPKVGVPWQFCEIDSVCSDSGTWNAWGPGLEVERLGHHEALTADQIHWLGEIGRWLDAEWGLPNVRYTGPRFGAQSFHGHVNHSDIASNPDGLTAEEWVLVIARAEPSRVAEVEDDMLIAEVTLTDGRVVNAIRGDTGGVFYRILGVDGHYESPGWKQIAGACRFTPQLLAWRDGVCRMKVIGSDRGVYEAVLVPDGHDFGPLFPYAPGSVALTGDYS